MGASGLGSTFETQSFLFCDPGTIEGTLCGEDTEGGCLLVAGATPS